MQSHYGRILYRARKYDEATVHLRKAIELDPQNFGAYRRLADVYEQTGRFRWLWCSWHTVCVCAVRTW
jgi:Flp pilus assembly protein TadD